MSNNYPDIAVIEGQRYYQALLKQLPQAKKRIVLAAMLMLSGEQADHIFDEIKKAQKRGVTVRVLIDNYSRFPALHKQSDGRARVKRTLATLQELTTLGARVYYFGRIGLVPYKGRCHLKITVVDDDVYSFGGVNFSDESFLNADYMLHVQNRHYADCVEELIKRVGTMRPPLSNGAEEMDKVHTILFDGGKRHDSIIYDKACELTAQAEQIYYVSQMVPSSKLAHLLNETKSTLYFNRVEQMKAPESWGQAFDQQKYRLINSYTRERFIHAKLMLFELPGGRKALLTGSNNFSYRGVAFGTQEIALYSTNEALWKKLYTFIQKNIA